MSKELFQEEIEKYTLDSKLPTAAEALEEKEIAEVQWLESSVAKKSKAPALKDYTAESIRSLDAIEHIRLRPGMYIGRLGNGENVDDGIYVLLKEILDNAVDEFSAGFGKIIELNIDAQRKQIRVRDYGRGVPFEKLIDCFSKINTGAKYNSDVFHYSVGLNGVGSKAVNALSSFFKVTSYQNSQSFAVRFEEGVFKSQKKENSDQSQGTEVVFWPDEKIFGTFSFQPEFIRERLFHYSCLHFGLRLQFAAVTFFCERGLIDFLAAKINFEENLYPLIAYRDAELEFVFVHQQNYGETTFSFVNGQYTVDGGTHLNAFREGILRGLNDFYSYEIQAGDLRDGFVGAISLRLQEPIFESQTKNRLGNSNIRKTLTTKIRQLIENHLHKNTTTAEALAAKIKINAQVRKEMQQIRKASRNTHRRGLLKIPQLKDCKYHRGDRRQSERATTIFLTEGQSATGSMVSARDVNFQAIYSLRGKPWNCWGYGLAELYKNEELYHLLLALGIEKNEEKLRYHQVVLATDADDDGLHIRNLLLTFFLYFFPNLVIQQHLFILETPLFRVRNNKETVYCYNEEQRDRCLEKLTRAEVTRFKGLGEISPQEFGQFIGKRMKLIPIRLSDPAHTKNLLGFFMGKNTPQRRDYIIKNLEKMAASLPL